MPNRVTGPAPHERTIMSDPVDQDRRSFLGTAAMTFAAAPFAFSGPADAQPSKPKPVITNAIKPGTNTSFASLKQIDAGLLNVGYAEAGPADREPGLPLHGWP